MLLACARRHRRRRAVAAAYRRRVCQGAMGSHHVSPPPWARGVSSDLARATLARCCWRCAARCRCSPTSPCSQPPPSAAPLSWASARQAPSTLVKQAPCAWHARKHDGNKNDERLFWHCGAHRQAAIGVQTPLPCYQNLLLSIARGASSSSLFTAKPPKRAAMPRVQPCHSCGRT